jgi:hypothetical protein
MFALFVFETILAVVHVYPVAPLADRFTDCPKQMAVLLAAIVITGFGLVGKKIVVVFTQVPSEAVTVYIVETPGATVTCEPVADHVGGPAVHVKLEAPAAFKTAGLFSHTIVGFTIAETGGKLFTNTVMTCMFIQFAFDFVKVYVVVTKGASIICAVLSGPLGVVHV